MSEPTNAERVDQLKEVLTRQVGESWLKDVSDAELEYFLYWAAHTGVYPIRTSEVEWVKNNEPLTGHAFRGFVTGLKFNKRLVK